MSGQYDAEIASVPPEHLRVLCRWVEDRFVNAVTPLAMRLQREPAVHFRCDMTLREARRAVEHVMEHVQEIRELAAPACQVSAGRDSRQGAANGPGTLPAASCQLPAGAPEAS